MALRNMSLTLALIIAFILVGCAGPQTAEEPASGEPEAGESAQESVEGDDEANDEYEDETNETEEVLPEKETKMADPNAPDDVAAPPEDATTTDSGLAYRILEEGQGDQTPAKTDTVRVHYTGWTTDGKKFDSSHDRGKPAEFPLNKVIPGWTEGVAMMSVGEKRRLWIPEDLAYGGRPGAPQGMLVFDVELIAIVD